MKQIRGRAEVFNRVRKMRRATFLLCALMLLPEISRAEVRVWTSRNGDTVEAEFVKYDKGRVHLKTREGKLLVVGIRQLSKEDQEQVPIPVAGRILSVTVKRNVSEGYGKGKHSVLAVRAKVTGGSELVAVPRLLARCLFDYSKTTEYTSFGWFSTTTTRTKAKGYVVQGVAQDLIEPTEHGRIRLSELGPNILKNLPFELGNPAGLFGKVKSDKEYLVGYRVQLVHGGTVLDTWLWEKKSSVKRLIGDHDMPVKWWE